MKKGDGILCEGSQQARPLCLAPDHSHLRSSVICEEKEEGGAEATGSEGDYQLDFFSIYFSIWPCGVGGYIYRRQEFRCSVYHNSDFDDGILKS